MSNSQDHLFYLNLFNSDTIHSDERDECDACHRNYLYYQTNVIAAEYSLAPRCQPNQRSRSYEHRHTV